MTYPNITDKNTRDALAKTLARWHREKKNYLQVSKGYKHGYNICTVLAAQEEAWIFGFRRALKITGDP